MDNFLSDVLQCNILPFLLFHETRRISRVCSLFNTVVSRSKHYDQPSESEICRNAKDWMEGASKYRKRTMDILHVDNQVFTTMTFEERSYLAYFMIYQHDLYERMPADFVDLINTRKISLRNVSRTPLQQRRLTDFVCNILEFVRVPVANHLCSVNYLDEYNNAATMTINSLDLSSNALTDAAVMDLCDAISRRFCVHGRFTLLKHISLSGNPRISDRSIKRLFRTFANYCPFLKSIDLSQTNVSNQSCVQIHRDFIAKNNQAISQRPNTRYNLRKPQAIHIKLYGTRVDHYGVAMVSQMGKDAAGNSVRIKAYCDQKIRGKPKVHSQRNMRDLIQRMKRQR